MAVSVKMNVLLYAPPLLLLMLKVHTFFSQLNMLHSLSIKVLSRSLLFSHMQAMDITGVLLALGGAALVQVP